MQRTIESPGVEINEVDLSLRTVTPVGTKTLVHGFAAQGPANELINISSKEELDQIFFGGGGPTNAAERYFYSSCREILNSPATLMVTRLPYGSGGGTGFSGEYQALAYPIVGGSSTYASSTSVNVGEPVVVPLTETQYYDIKSGLVTWSVSGGTVSDFASIGNAGFIIVNDAKSTINEKYEGYYVALADNSVLNLSGFQSVSSVNTLGSGNALQDMSSSLLGFYLTGTDTEQQNSMSEIVETSYNYDFTNAAYNDSLILYLFRLRTSNYESDPDKLYFANVEKYIGSLESNDQRPNEVNGQMASFYLMDRVNNNSNYIQMFVNTNLANKATIGNVVNTSKELYPVGSYTPCKASSTLKHIGNVPEKIERALTLAESTQSMDIDIVIGGGLETVWAYVEAADGVAEFDDTANVSTGLTALSNATTGASSDFAMAHKRIFDLYNNFCSNIRKDCVHYSDPLRCVFVQGEKAKTLDRSDKNFTSNILVPMKNLYSAANSNYAATYANWVSIYDNNSNKYIWMPFSAWQAAITARMDARLQPWYAPFGLNNGLIPNITDIAFKPNQKQQDALYRVGINPVVYFQGDGYVVWGQKTLQAKPSAFDRLNVRRLFLVLERSTMKILRYYVGEPNTIFTRTRVNNVLKPIFDLAKNNEGCYDYMVVCDERNNTPTVIDNNEMKVDIYIKPVRTAEFILVTFYATRTDQDFNELVG
jgi:hypothetical protein